MLSVLTAYLAMWRVYVGRVAPRASIAYVVAVVRYVVFHDHSTFGTGSKHINIEKRRKSGRWVGMKKTAGAGGWMLERRAGETQQRSL